MNGRIYDPKLGRMLQADPFVQSPTNSQSLNRYSYVLNNPLSYTDPSGYFVSELFNFARAFVRVVASEGFDITAWADLVTSAIALINAFSGQAAAFIPGIAIGSVARSGGSLSTGQGNSRGSREIEEAFRDPRLATLGGTVSEITNNNFGNGAKTRAHSYANDSLLDRELDQRFDNNKSWYHVYGGEGEGDWPLCTNDQQWCSQDRAFEAGKYFAFPGQDNSVPVTNNRIYPVYGPANWFVGDIKVRLEQSSYSIFNITLPNHDFYDGYVRRSFVWKENTLMLRTYGEGNNRGFFSWMANQALWQPGFNQYNYQLRQRMAQDWLREQQ